MALQVLEGTWEEIAQHAAEFSGKRVRLMVLGEATPHNGTQPLENERPLSELLEGLIGVVDSSAPTPPFPHKQRAWGEAIEEKFRKQGLKIP